MLRSCASCAEQTDANLSCARCRTLYCSRTCQKKHWISGHKKACAGIARAHHDTDIEAQSRALAHAARMSGGAPNDARYLFCLDGGDTEDPPLRRCACRGSFGWTHMGSLVKSAEAARVPTPPAYHFAAWVYCLTCKQKFTGLVQLRFAMTLWAKHARAVETNLERLLAATLYTMALSAAGEHAEAARLQRSILDVRTRTLGPDHRETLISASNLAASLVHLGECAEVAALLQSTLAVRTRTLGSDEPGTRMVEGHLTFALFSLREYAEVETLGRGTLEKMRRILGPGHHETLATSANLAASLAHQGKHTEAVEIGREVLVQNTRLLGAEHERTRILAFNLAHSLSLCGQKSECEQLFRETLALCRRTLGPAHDLTMCVLQNMRELGLAAGY